jgi:hypothetical protein
MINEPCRCRYQDDESGCESRREVPRYGGK